MPFISEGIPARFNSLLKQKGYLRPGDFVKDTELPKTTVYGMASGKTMPRIDTIEIVCEKLGVDFLEFFSYAKKKPVEYEIHTEGNVSVLEIYNQLDDDDREQVDNYAAFLLARKKHV